MQGFWIAICAAALIDARIGEGVLCQSFSKLSATFLFSMGRISEFSCIKDNDLDIIINPSQI
ncbi:MAG TPA: hypothetical protein DCL61_07015 [Cyanobacteria bacterium UBA12227]|nr:hypothetical protein [Cyanobacteria bacterium UBA12227]HAX89851.1 hypothetical protein [Cyanobacteria bacterium UBA11370]